MAGAVTEPGYVNRWAGSADDTLCSRAVASEHDKYAAVWPLWFIGIGIFFLTYAYGIRYSPIGERFGLGFLAIGLTWQLGVRVLIRRQEEPPIEPEHHGFHPEQGGAATAHPDPTPPAPVPPVAPVPPPAAIPAYQDDDATMVPAPAAILDDATAVPSVLAPVVLEEATVMTHLDDYEEATKGLPQFDDPTDPNG